MTFFSTLHRRVSTGSAPALVLAIIVIVEALRLVPAAAARRLWYDELCTLHVSSIRPLTRLVEALTAGVDSMPPAYHLLVAAFSSLPLDPHVGLRLPSILGYLSALVAVALFVWRSSGPLAGLAAALLLGFSPFRQFAIEARPYTILVGSFAVAAVYWQRVEARRSGPWWLAAALFVSTASHHLAVGLVACLAAAETLGSLFERRWRPGVWAAMVLAATPALVNLPILLHFKAMYATTYWAQPSLDGAVRAYSPLLGLSNHFALLLVATCAASLGLGLRHASAADRRDSLLCLALVLYPLVLGAAATLGGGGFTARYGLPAVLGFVWSIARARLLQRHGAGAPILASGLALFFGLAARDVLVSPTDAPATVSAGLPARLMQWSRSQGDVPVVVASGIYYFPVHYYATPELRARLRRVVDVDEATLHGKTASVDMADAVMARYVPLRVEPLGPFLARHERFVLYSTNDVFSWLPGTLLKAGYELRLLGEDGQGEAYLITPGSRK